MRGRGRFRTPVSVCAHRVRPNRTRTAPQASPWPVAPSHQYLSIGELAGGAYRDNYVLVILRENVSHTGLELSGMVAPPEARRAIYALFGDEAHFSLLEPLRAYSPAQPSIFSQAPPALQPVLEAVYAEQQAPRSNTVGRRASWQLRTPSSDQLVAGVLRPPSGGVPLITIDHAVGTGPKAAASPRPLAQSTATTAMPAAGPVRSTSTSLWESGKHADVSCARHGRRRQRPRETRRATEHVPCGAGSAYPIGGAARAPCSHAAGVTRRAGQAEADGGAAIGTRSAWDRLRQPRKVRQHQLIVGAPRS